MRIRLEFSLENNECPQEYRRCIISFIKNALIKAQEGKKFEEYYHDTCQKDFTWGTILPDAVFKKRKIILSDTRFTVIMSTDDRKQTGFYMMMAFIRQKGRKYPMGSTNYMTLKSVKQSDQQVIVKNECQFKNMPGSPVVVREHHKEKNRDKYYTVEDELFKEKLLESIKCQLQIAGYSENMIKGMEVEIINGRKILVLHYGVYIDANIIDFKIKAPALILQHLYQNGVASRKSAGFGMLDVL